MTDVLIIGGGVAGMSAALNSLRGGKTVKIIERDSFGGQIAKSPKVENYPTIKAISGLELSDKMFDQIMDMGVEFDLDNITHIEKDGDIFKLQGEFNTYEAKVVIIATGVSPRKIGLEGEDELVGKGISYCAVCDGAFYKGEDVVLIGDANTALQYAILLSGYCKKIYLNTLYDHFFADQVLVDRVKEIENIEVHHNLSIKKLNYTEELESCDFEDSQTHSIVRFKTRACFVCIGQVPHNEIFKDLVDLDNRGYIIADETCETKTKGLYVAGDCRTKKYRQVVTAVADGSICAISAVNYLNSLK